MINGIPPMRYIMAIVGLKGVGRIRNRKREIGKYLDIQIWTLNNANAMFLF